MTIAGVAGFIAMVAALTAGGPRKDAFDLKVERVRLLHNQAGDLHVDIQGVTFRSQDGKTTIKIPMRDLRGADVADPRSLRFETYQGEKWDPIKRQEYAFRTKTDSPVEDLAQFLAAHVLRPVVGHYSSEPRFRIPVYHKRFLGSTSGTLEISEEGIRFISDKPSDSRTWLYRDIETIGRPDLFRFRVTTSRETYVLELKAELSQTAYEFAWRRVYDLERSSP